MAAIGLATQHKQGIVQGTDLVVPEYWGFVNNRG